MKILVDAFLNQIDLIVSGNKDLLVLKNYKEIKIVSPHNFFEFVK